MYNPGGDYLTYIKDSIIRKPRSKIVVDGKTYTGLEHLVSFPKITHETEKMIGGFPAKTCEFEIYNLDGKLSLNGKEVQVYRGLDISDTKTVWIPMGLFYADGEDVTNNSTKRTIQFKGTDRTRLFDSPFANVYSNGIIPADTVISTVAEKICAKHGLTINAATKANIISYRFTEAVGTPEDTTDRQVIAWIAELSGCIPIISRDGQSLMFTRPSYKSTVTESGKTYPSGSYADKRKYKALSAEPLYGPINAISFGHADYDDAYVYQDDTDVETNGLHEWKINDNALAENDKSALAPKVFAIIKGMQIYPFELTDFIDDYLFDINDGIQIKKKDGAFVTTYVLGMKTTSRIRSVFKAGTQDSSSADRNLAGSVKLDMKKVKLSVDHINNQIIALVKETDEKYSKLTQTVDGFETEIANTKSGLEAKIEATAEKAELTYAKRETVDGQIKGITDQLEGIDGKIEGKVTTEVQQDTTISILAGKVESKISGNYVTKATYDDEKKNWLLKTTYDSYVKQTDQQISAAVSKVQKLENAGYITKAVCNSLIDQKSDSIALTVESNLKYESRNLLMESECFEHLTPTGYHATYQGDYVSTDATYLPSGKARKLTVKANDDSQIAGVSFSPSDTVGGVDKIKPNTTYTLSFWARLYPDDATQSLSSQASVYTATAPNNAIIDTKRTRGLALTKSWQKVVIVFTTQSTVSSFLLRFALAGCVNGQQYAIGISSLKLEIGNVATEWATRTPSAAEVEEYAKSEIAQLPDRITLSVEKNLKIGARNILLNSECFAGFTPTKYKVKTASMVPSRSDTYVPSGRYSSVVFTPEPTGGSTSRGIRFVETDILGQSTVDKVKPNTTYTLSFWLKTTDSAPVDELEKYSVIYAGEGASVSLDLNRSVTPTPTTSWQKYVLTFTITGTISKFYIMLFFKNCLASTQDSDIQYWIDISSFKLEEGNIATDWTPSTDDIDQSVKSVQAKIDMCVQKDENNNLVSEINIASNKLAINTDNFTLAKDGTMSCTGATITGGTILCGDTNTSMLIAQGAIVHKFDGTEIGQIGLTMNPDSSGNMQYYERISGTVGVQISANNYATFVDDAGFVVCSNARDTTINVSISSTTDWSYASYSSALRSIVEADSALIVSANRGNNNLYLEGSSIVTCGQLEALNDVKISGQLEALSGVKLRAAIGTSSSKSYVYVVADKKTGEIGFLSA